jgi:hypothetical protein
METIERRLAGLAANMPRRVKPKVGSIYKLRDDPQGLGDWSGDHVLVEKGPRGKDKTEQYRASYGPGGHYVDWIHTHMFHGSQEITEPKERAKHMKRLKYTGPVIKESER